MSEDGPDPSDGDDHRPAVDDPEERVEELDRAGAALRDGDLVVYPTETVYGLGGDATSEAAVERVYEVKGRSRDNPLSLGVPSVDAALAYTRPTPLAERFMRAFLPGPVTVVVRRRDSLPDALTAGRERVGVRVPDHALARALFDAADCPVTATSANVSGRPSVRRTADLDDRVRERVACLLDGGETPGTESTVVDPDEGVIHRRGSMAGAIEAWLDEAEDGT